MADYLSAVCCRIYSVRLMQSVGKVAGKVVEEVRRQFKEIAGIMEGHGKPDYAKCVDIVTKGAIDKWFCRR